jgi:hypothetical protein
MVKERGTSAKSATPGRMCRMCRRFPARLSRGGSRSPQRRGDIWQNLCAEASRISENLIGDRTIAPSYEDRCLRTRKRITWLFALLERLFRVNFITLHKDVIDRARATLDALATVFRFRGDFTMEKWIQRRQSPPASARRSRTPAY